MNSRTPLGPTGYSFIGYCLQQPLRWLHFALGAYQVVAYDASTTLYHFLPSDRLRRPLKSDVESREARTAKLANSSALAQLGQSVAAGTCRDCFLDLSPPHGDPAGCCVIFHWRCIFLASFCVQLQLSHLDSPHANGAWGLACYRSFWGCMVHADRYSISTCACLAVDSTSRSSGRLCRPLSSDVQGFLA